MADLKTMAEELVNLTVKEVNSLQKLRKSMASSRQPAVVAIPLLAVKAVARGEVRRRDPESAGVPSWS